MANIDNYAPHTGRFLKNDNTEVNIADLMGGGVLTATITSGASVSNVIDLEGYQLSAFCMPAAWDAAAISFLSAPTADGTFEPVYADGIEVTEPVAAGRCCPISSNALALASLRFIKLRSGVAATPVVQTAARTITLSLKR